MRAMTRIRHYLNSYSNGNGKVGFQLKQLVDCFATANQNGRKAEIWDVHTKPTAVTVLLHLSFSREPTG
jgi:hypothetical protein